MKLLEGRGFCFHNNNNKSNNSQMCCLLVIKDQFTITNSMTEHLTPVQHPTLTECVSLE